MNSGSLTCRCRFCGNILGYSRDDIGTDARCPTCGGVIRLPGRLQKVATIERRRLADPLGMVLEIAGFVLMFVFFPWGAAAGIIVVLIGWRRCNRLVCSSCTANLPGTKLERCPKCRTPFSIE